MYNVCSISIRVVCISACKNVWPHTLKFTHGYQNNVNQLSLENVSLPLFFKKDNDSEVSYIHLLHCSKHSIRLLDKQFVLLSLSHKNMHDKQNRVSEVPLPLTFTKESNFSCVENVFFLIFIRIFFLSSVGS